MALIYSGWNTYLAQVAEVEVTGSGDIGVRRVVCAVDCGSIVGGSLWGEEITLKNDRVEQSNFHDFRVVRMNETPPIEVHLVRNLEAPGGIGEPGTAATGVGERRVRCNGKTDSSAAAGKGARFGLSMPVRPRVSHSCPGVRFHTSDEALLDWHQNNMNTARPARRRCWRPSYASSASLMR